MLHNLIRLPNPDVPIYRTFRLGHFRQALAEGTLVLVAPTLWDDPFENFLIGCAITYRLEGKWRQEFVDRVRKPVYAQCWSLTPESDAQWRVYSTVVKDPKTGRNTAAEQEGVKVRTTPRTLLSLLWAASPTPPEDACFLGQVEYMSQERAAQRVANEVARERLNAFGGGLGHAETLLVKRDPFKHETEVRLVYVEHRDGYGSDHIFAVPFDPNSTFEEVMLDPRLHPDDVKEREAEFSSLGFKHPVKKSNLYQRVLYEIVLDE